MRRRRRQRWRCSGVSISMRSRWSNSVFAVAAAAEVCEPVVMDMRFVLWKTRNTVPERRAAWKIGSSRVTPEAASASASASASKCSSMTCSRSTTRRLLARESWRHGCGWCSSREEEAEASGVAAKRCSTSHDEPSIAGRTPCADADADGLVPLYGNNNLQYPGL